MELTEPNGVAEAFERCSELGSVTGLVNNAGTSATGRLEAVEIADFDKVFGLNVVAPALCAKYSIPSMKRAGWGRIVNVSSRSMLGKENRTVYSASKGALLSGLASHRLC